MTDSRLAGCRVVEVTDTGMDRREGKKPTHLFVERKARGGFAFDLVRKVVAVIKRVELSFGNRSCK